MWDIDLPSLTFILFGNIWDCNIRCKNFLQVPEDLFWSIIFSFNFLTEFRVSTNKSFMKNCTIQPWIRSPCAQRHLRSPCFSLSLTLGILYCLDEKHILIRLCEWSVWSKIPLFAFKPLISDFSWNYKIWIVKVSHLIHWTRNDQKFKTAGLRDAD